MGEKKSIDGDATLSLATDIIAAIRSSENGKSMDLKVLRAAVLTAENSSDKSFKKLFKSAVKLLEKQEKVSLSSEGVVKLSKSERRASSAATSKKDKKRSKRKAKEEGADEMLEESDEKTKKMKQRSTEDENEVNAKGSQQHEQNNDDNDDDDDDDEPQNKNNPCKNNPQGITRLFVGNLPFAISEPTLNTHLEECITHVKWITDKTTGKFYGSAFVEVRNSKDAAKAVTQMNGTTLMGRPIKINFAPVRLGEENDWPPRSRVITGGKLANTAAAGGGGGQAGGSGIKALSAKPDGCCKLFIGNLSYEIDDEGITKFFMSVDAEIKAVRWLYHQDSGDFKGCGYVDFWNTTACEKAATLHGKNLLGRPLRIDWAE